MKELYKLKDFLKDEISECMKKEDISSQELDTLYKIVDIIKDIYEIEEKEMELDTGYSQAYRRRGGSYDRMTPDYDMVYENRKYDDSNNSYRRGRDSMTGRYVSRDSGMMSRDGDKHEMISRLEDMMDTATNDKERNTILSCIEKLKD